MEVAPFFVDFHHFLSIFTFFYRFSRFTHFCRDLRTFSAIFFLAKIASPQHHTLFACMFPPLFFDSRILTKEMELGDPPQLHWEEQYLSKKESHKWISTYEVILFTTPLTLFTLIQMEVVIFRSWGRLIDAGEEIGNFCNTPIFCTIKFGHKKGLKTGT